MVARGFYINDIFFDTYSMPSKTIYNNIDEVIKKCYDEFTEWVDSSLSQEKRGLITIEFGKKLDLYEHIRVTINRLVNDIDRKYYGRLHTPIKAFLNYEDGKLIFRCANSSKCFINDESDDIHSYIGDYAQVIKPIILPVILVHEYVNVIKIKDISGEWITYKNPEKVEYVNNHANMLIEDKGIEHVIHFAEVKRFTQNLYRFELNKE